MATPYPAKQHHRRGHNEGFGETRESGQVVERCDRTERSHRVGGHQWHEAGPADRERGPGTTATQACCTRRGQPVSGVREMSRLPPTASFAATDRPPRNKEADDFG